MSAVRTALTFALLATTACALTAQDDTSGRKRAVSNNLAAALADTMPKFNPPPPEPENKDDEVDEDLMLKPKNGIVRLPQVVVEGRRPPIFTERQVNTDKGLAALATQRYFSASSQVLNKFSIPLLTMSQEELATMMWKEDERLRLLKDMENQSGTALLLSGEDEARELRNLSNSTLGRTEFLPAASALNRETKGN